ncbi:segregation/condensation protein A [Clostridium luticellarii]|jgi:segregation and condensation protein A|uniref:Segregation and condensation protein A n=1 Tax=Clostridium luticellarii TaxID=1691940 RepID=A0A2T0BRM2_9CLOT|nr:segregation/condensation protein A [Clostridium luticellarii]MCI1943769.1 segregation/condensation protein A [Clostridium luticellarii]MCI1967030.1 segregation/condensation protein A [Clostridium luticellarii]MCI1994397.1 segregation/condensation protein A [Clostridium luticellarii]MCI2038650.1 segregation/condensation protein A [Clostridium luticellarii]PRR86524.1 Segregation and condensation protein A [Clostridium luticellarii]
MSLNIKIENFEGPFDVLLHLIKKNKMNIYDIKIYEITEQYLKYINDMRDMDLDIASEFIVIAASLIEIKSKTLLPKVNLKDYGEDEGEDPRKELVDKLLQYKKFKAAAEFFKKRCGKIGKMYGKKPEIIEVKHKNVSEILKGITMLDMYHNYIRLMEEYESKFNNGIILDKKISMDKFKLEDKIIYVKDLVFKSKKVKFSTIIKDCPFKMEKIVTFLALLELIKLKTVFVVQNENFSEIYIERVIENEK